MGASSCIFTRTISIFAIAALAMWSTCVPCQCRVSVVSLRFAVPQRWTRKIFMAVFRTFPRSLNPKIHFQTCIANPESANRHGLRSYALATPTPGIRYRLSWLRRSTSGSQAQECPCKTSPTFPESSLDISTTRLATAVPFADRVALIIVFTVLHLVLCKIHV